MRSRWNQIKCGFPSFLLPNDAQWGSSGAGRRDVADLSSTVCPEPIAGHAVATLTVLPRSSAAGLGSASLSTNGEASSLMGFDAITFLQWVVPALPVHKANSHHLFSFHAGGIVMLYDMCFAGDFNISTRLDMLNQSSPPVISTTKLVVFLQLMRLRLAKVKL